MSNITIAASAVTAKLIDAPIEVKLLVQELLSYKTDGRTVTAFSDGKWSGRSSFFEFAPATFPAGFVPLVMAKLTQAKHTVRLVKRPLPAALGPVLPIVDAFGHDDARYDFHMQVVDKVVRHGQIIAQVATGGGKSRIAKLCYKRIARPTLFLTTRGILMHQMADAVRELDGARSVGVLGDGEWSPTAGFNVGMVQTFAARLKNGDPDLAAFMERFEFVIMEEAHEASSSSFYDMMRMCKNANYRLALTATPFMKDSEEANMRLMASSGPVAIKVSEELLIQRGILAQPIFKFIRFEDPIPEGAFEKKDDKGKPLGLAPGKLYKSMPWPKCYEIGVTHGVKRNGIVVHEAKRAVEHGLSVVVLVQQQVHGKKLQTMLSDAGLRCLFIWGESSKSERKAAIDALKDGRLQVLIGSTILDVGVDMPALGMVIIASAGKAEVALRQRIGRGLRAKKSGPNIAHIIDFDDWQSNYLRDHSRERRAIIDGTPGFVEGILPPGKDFDYSVFTQKAA